MLQDKRGRKIALLAHCLLNQNAKVGGLAQHPGIVPGIVELLAQYGFAIVQMPCPEMAAAGIKRWGQVKEQYMGYGFSKAFKEAAVFLLDSVADYVNEGYRVILIGIDGSPSCGVDVTESNGNWGGTMLAADEFHVDNIRGPGAFIEILQKEAAARGMGQLPAIGIPMDIEGGVVDLPAIERFIALF